MKRYQLYLLIAIAIIGTVELTSCGAAVRSVNIPLSVSHPEIKKYYDTDIPVKLVVKSYVNENSLVDYPDCPSKIQKWYNKTHYTLKPSLKLFAEKATSEFMEDMHFSLSQSADYTLYVDIKLIKCTLSVDQISRKKVETNAKYVIKLNYRMTNEAGETIIPTSSVSSSFNSDAINGYYVNPGYSLMTMGSAYADALSKVNWDRIADCLRVAKTANQEKNAQVSGAGDTALEHTVIRWYIQSKPQGADVSWRVVSSTPDVSNTNSTYVGTTPYESTEAFDIRGLTYNNSGNVQIEVSCEKDGYLTQRKRFNLRQAIDQKEIATKFNLIKDEY